MNDRRIARIQEQIKAKVAQVVSQELADPSLGMVTITRVEVDRERMMCKVFWSCLGTEKAIERNGQVLNRARSFVRREVASVLSTRTVPDVKFVFDKSIAGAIRVQNILNKLKDDRDDTDTPTDDERPGNDG